MLIPWRVFTYIWLKSKANVGTYSIHGASGGGSFDGEHLGTRSYIGGAILQKRFWVIYSFSC